MCWKKPNQIIQHLKKQKIQTSIEQCHLSQEKQLVKKGKVVTRTVISNYINIPII